MLIRLKCEEKEGASWGEGMSKVEERTSEYHPVFYINPYFLKICHIDLQKYISKTIDFYTYILFVNVKK